jgi:hypothetical protein
LAGLLVCWLARLFVCWLVGLLKLCLLAKIVAASCQIVGLFVGGWLVQLGWLVGWLLNLVGLFVGWLVAVGQDSRGTGRGSRRGMTNH